MRGMGDKNYRRHFRLNNLRFLGLLLVVAVVCVYVGSSLGPAPHRYDRFTTPPARAQKFVVPATMADQSVPSNNLVDAPALHSVPLSSSPSRPPLPSLLLNSGSGPRTAVLGMARKIDLPSAYRFVRSLRTHTPATDIILFTDQESLTAPLKAMYDMFQVKVVLFDVARDLPANMASFHPSSYRWVLMRDYLRQSAKEGGSVSKPYDLLLFSDVRDVVFQRDIFAAMQRAEGNGHGFYAFQEQRPATIAQCGWNSGWVRDCFGDEGLQKVGHNVISCSGTSMASWDDGVAYVELLAQTLETKPQCERNGIDQGLHNYYLYSGDLASKVSALHIISNEEGFITTVQSMPSLTRDHAGRVLNTRGEVSAAVHQYDRSQQLKDQYEREFVWLDSLVLLLK